MTNEAQTEARTTHTPGPWTVGEYGSLGGEHWDEYPIHAEDNPEGVIAMVWPWGDESGQWVGTAEQVANARLIAAAPALLEALEGLMQYDNQKRRHSCDTLPVCTRCDFEQAAAAIRAARGEA